MVLPRYCAVRLKEMYLNFYSIYMFSVNVSYNNTKYIILKYNIIFVSYLVLHLFTFLCFPIIIFAQILDFIELLCTHDFSRVTFA